MSRLRREAAERERALRSEADAARDRVKDILESIHDGFIAFDQDWRLTYINSEAERMTGSKSGRNRWTNAMGGVP